MKIALLMMMIVIVLSCNLNDDNGESSDNTSYDLRDECLITPVKNQCGENPDGECDIGTSVGICWAFSSLASLESSMLKQGIVLNPELEEASLSCWYLGNYIGFNLPCYEFNEEVIPGVQPPTEFGYYYPGYGWGGGTSHWTCDYLISGKELPLWSNIPMPLEDMNDHNTLTVPVTENKEKYQIHDMVLLLTIDFDSNEQYIDEIKEYIRSTGAMQTLVHMEPIDYERITTQEVNGTVYEGHRFIDHDNYNMFTYEESNWTTQYLTHAVTITGWDDQREIDIDGHRTEGAWLIKDSQGENSWDNGYFWVAYEDPAVNNITTGLKACVRDLYQHQSKYQTHPGALSNIISIDDIPDNSIFELGSYSYLLNGYDTEDSWGIAEFAIENEESLAGVGLFTANRNQDIRIEVYKDYLSSDPLLSEKFAVENTGYHILDFYSDIHFESNVTMIIAACFEVSENHNRRPLIYVCDPGYEYSYPTYFGRKEENVFNLTSYSDFGDGCSFFMQAIVK